MLWGALDLFVDQLGSVEEFFPLLVLSDFFVD